MPAEKEATGCVSQSNGSHGMQEALLHKFLLFPAAYLFLSVGIRKVVQVYWGAALACAHHI